MRRLLEAHHRVHRNSGRPAALGCVRFTTPTAPPRRGREPTAEDTAVDIEGAITASLCLRPGTPAIRDGGFLPPWAGRVAAVTQPADGAPAPDAEGLRVVGVAAGYAPVAVALRASEDAVADGPGAPAPYAVAAAPVVNGQIGAERRAPGAVEVVVPRGRPVAVAGAVPAVVRVVPLPVVARAVAPALRVHGLARMVVRMRAVAQRPRVPPADVRAVREGGVVRRMMGHGREHAGRCAVAAARALRAPVLVKRQRPARAAGQRHRRARVPAAGGPAFHVAARCAPPAHDSAPSVEFPVHATG